jgi:hypothetical protein
MFVIAGGSTATEMKFGAKNSTPECIGKHFFVSDRAQNGFFSSVCASVVALSRLARGLQRAHERLHECRAVLLDFRCEVAANSVFISVYWQRSTARGVRNAREFANLRVLHAARRSAGRCENYCAKRVRSSE